MNAKLVEDVAAAVLYEGFLLYPYRKSAVKNRQRFHFGVLYPRAWAERQSGADLWQMQTECLLRAPADAVPTVRVRYLQLMGDAAEEREIAMPPATLAGLAQSTSALDVSATMLAPDLYRLRVVIRNASTFDGDSREQALQHSMISTHTILGIDRGAFVSLLDPPGELREAAAACDNRGTWPVLAGEDGATDAMLSSPIILYDYPKIAPESPGPLFDGTEIDEILTLRIMTLTDEEKRAMAETDERAREILERTDSLPPEQFLKLHGVLRGLRATGEEAP